jgi:hypothetical protein
MQLFKKRLYAGKPSPGFKSLRNEDIVKDYIERDKETLDDGIFFEDCQVAGDHWDENWTRCPICLAPLWLYIYDDGREEIVVEHNSMAQFHQ